MRGSGFVPFVEPETLTAQPGEPGGPWASVEETILLDLIHSYPLSANGDDSIGTNHLDTNSGVTFVAKGVGAPANMPATVANFADAGDVLFGSGVPSPGADFSVAMWVDSSDTAADRNIITLGNAWPNGIQFSARTGTAGSGGVNVLVGSGAAFVQSLNDGLVIHDGAWHLLLFTFTEADGLIRTYVDNVQGNSSAALGAPHYPDSAVLALGLRSSLQDYVGRQSGVLIAGRAWTANERSLLWSDGDGYFIG